MRCFPTVVLGPEQERSHTGISAPGSLYSSRRRRGANGPQKLPILLPRVKSSEPHGMPRTLQPWINGSSAVLARDLGGDTVPLPGDPSSTDATGDLAFAGCSSWPWLSIERQEHEVSPKQSAEDHPGNSSISEAPGSSHKRPERQSAISYDYAEEELMASIEQEYCR
ncbi:cystin-1 isoform X2 [Pteropus medius]|uniref:cystin-1 isoform X2 n=1 Tax=Pteropus vampyrus TaxID=132908 RepID=UPI00196B0806|nr:cystin-1 isoform X2 [Pteropus giganteus]